MFSLKLFLLMVILLAIKHSISMPALESTTSRYNLQGYNPKIILKTSENINDSMVKRHTAAYYKLKTLLYNNFETTMKSKYSTFFKRTKLTKEAPLNNSIKNNSKLINHNTTNFSFLKEIAKIDHNYIYNKTKIKTGFPYHSAPVAPTRNKKLDKVFPFNNNHKLNNNTKRNHYTQMNLKKKKTKPTIYKIAANWSDKPPYELKQDWYQNGPTPNPEITNYSPDFSLTDTQGVLNFPSSADFSLENPISQSSAYITKNPVLDSDGCPTVFLTNSVFGPSSKQTCPDLNLVINTHVHQSTVTERFPEVPPNTVEEDVVENSATSGNVANVADAAVAADEVPVAPAAAPASAGSPGGGGIQGALPGLPGISNFPDFSSLLNFLGFLRDGWTLLQTIFNALGSLRWFSPLLWIFPVLSFLLGFLMILPFYPWWLPIIFFAARRKDPARPEVVLYHHNHKPVHHYDGWFWNHNTKTWSNVYEYAESRNTEDFTKMNIILHLIDSFGQKYNNHTAQSWKIRKK